VFLVDIDTMVASLPEVNFMRLSTGVQDGGTGASITLYSWIAGTIIR
jgi:hypothetical protein